MVVSQNKLGFYGNGTGQGGEVNAPKLAGGEGPVAIHVQTRQDGTTENAECANRGICNRASGVCACFDGFGSSQLLYNLLRAMTFVRLCTTILTREMSCCH